MTNSATALERKGVEAAVQTYLDGLYEGDADKIASVFHPTSSLVQQNNDRIQQQSRGEWLEKVRNRMSPKAAGHPRHDKILHVDLATPTMAFVKLNCAVPPRFFTDYLCLLKTDGKWQVAQKVFATELRT